LDQKKRLLVAKGTTKRWELKPSSPFDFDVVGDDMTQSGKQKICELVSDGEISGSCRRSGESKLFVRERRLKKRWQMLERGLARGR